MLQLFNNPVGRLRIIGFLEGISLLVLVFVAVPLKYGADRPALASIMGTIHGALFLLFVFNTLSVGVTLKWKFTETTWKVLLACILPFGTFYIDRTILRKVRWTDDQAKSTHWE
jgi:integral membrane protein